MPKHHGKQKRLAKKKKRRASRSKAKSIQGARSATSQPNRRSASASGVSSAAPTAGQYDANQAPDPQLWLQLEERDRMMEVGQYHERTLGPAEMPPSLAVHVGTHVLVENQLAEDDPPEVGRALARLMGEGMSRHDAVHAIGWVMADYMKKAVETQQAVDRAAYIQAVEALSTKSWVAAATTSQL